MWSTGTNAKNLKVTNQTEVKLVDSGMKLSLTLRAQWDVISAVWFEKWKLFVGYENKGKDEREEDDILALHPGPVDNNNLKGTFEDELRLGLVENVDFILLSHFQATRLYERYKTAGPRFTRDVVNVGTNYIQRLQISLYRVRFEVYHCDNDFPFPSKEDTKYFQVFNFDKTASYKDIMDTIKKKFYVSKACRFWLRENRERVDEVERTSETSLEDASSTETTDDIDFPAAVVTSKRPRVGRLLTTDVTDWENNWRFIRTMPEKLTAFEILGEGQDCVELILESSNTYGINPKDSDWPRADLLDKWRSDLRKDDILDARDSQKQKVCWYEGLVKDVTADGISVHYRSWAAKFDEVIPHAAVAERIKPLHTKTQDRNLWKVNDSIELKVSAPDQVPACWVAVKIDEVDRAHNRIKVTYSEKEKQALFEKTYKKKTSAPVTPVTPITVSAVEPQILLKSTNAFDSEKIAYASDAAAAKATAGFAPAGASRSRSTSSETAVAVVAEAVPMDDEVDRDAEFDEFLDTDGQNDEAKKSRVTARGAAVPVAYGSSSSSSSSSSAVRLDDDWKKLLSSGNPTIAISDHNNDDVEMSTAMIIDPTAAADEEEDDFYGVQGETEPDERTVWVDLMSEDICSLPTHTPKPEVVKSTHLTSITNRGVGGNYQYSSSSYNSYTDYDKHTKGTPPVVGAVGLSNLGNTCFMNSILQCLSNTQALTELFLDDGFKTQLNTDNPLGHGGKLATAYGKLIKDMWNDGYVKIVPREFKTVIGEFQPQFAGYDQQDSQELMGFLLDGMHEDLNRVVKKPHVSKIESKGRDDALIASESWRRYLLRNDSPLVDKCFGQLKSHVTCTNCGTESVTFDEFSSISLPIPIRNTRTVSVIVQLLPLGAQPPLSVDIEVELHDTMDKLSGILVKALRDKNLLPLQSQASYADLSDVFAAATGGVEGDNKLPVSHSLSVIHDVTRLSVADHFLAVPVHNVDQDDIAAMDIDQEEEEGEGECSAISSGVFTSEDYSTQQQQPVKEKSSFLSMINTADNLKKGVVSSTVTSRQTEILQANQAAVTHARNPPSITDSILVRGMFEGDEYSKCPLPNTLPPSLPSTTEGVQSENKGSDTHFEVKASVASTLSGVEDDKVVHFQFGTVSDFKLTNISKSYYPPDHKNTAIVSFVGKMDKLVAFQLSHKCEDVRTSYGYNKVENKDSKAADHIAMDICIGFTTTTTGYMYPTTSFEVVAYPLRVALPLTGATLTNKQVHLMVWHFMKRYLSDTSKYHDTAYVSGSEGPYSLWVSSTYGIRRHEVVCDDKEFVIPKPGQDVLSVSWNANMRSCEHCDFDMFKEITYTSTNKKRSSSVGIDDEEVDEGVQKKISIYSCLDKFIEREQLDAAETLYCGHCKQHLAPIKKMDVWAAPDVLILHLKRFQYVPGQYFVHREKINELIDFPVEGLDLSSYVKGHTTSSTTSNSQVDASCAPIYDLYAVSHHSGGLGGGHYTATCRNFKNGQWYNFNDSSVSETEASRAVSGTAYVLFYKRRTGSLKWSGIVPSTAPIPDEDPLPLATPMTTANTSSNTTKEVQGSDDDEEDLMNIDDDAKKRV